MRTIQLICDFREDFPTKLDTGLWNDHQDKNTFEQIQKAIIDLGYPCHIFGGVRKLINAVEKGEVLDKESIFINLSDGLFQPYSRAQIPILCELLSITYSGARIFEVVLISNKYYAKLEVDRMGISTPEAVLYKIDMNLEDCSKAINFLNFPVIVKPNTEGSSVGISDKSVCQTYDLLVQQIQSLDGAFNELIIEEYIPGFDVTNFIIGNKDNILLNEVLVVRHHDKTYFEKEVIRAEDYLLNKTSFIAGDSVLSADVINQVKAKTKLIVNKIDAYDFARIDYRVTNDGKIYFLEINSVPAINMNSQVGTICSALNISLAEFLGMIIKAVQDRYISHD